MGQAKLRGDYFQRVAQSIKNKLTPPKKGTYISTKPFGMRFVVEDVFISTPEDDTDGDFFLVYLIDEASEDDYSAMGDELDPDQWNDLVIKYGLIRE